MEVVPGTAMLINGLTNDVYNTEYPVKEFCLSHNRLDPIVELPGRYRGRRRLATLLALARERLGSGGGAGVRRRSGRGDGVPGLRDVEPVFKKMARLYEGTASCPSCGGRREMVLTHRIAGDEPYLGRTLGEFDVPPLSIIRARNGTAREYLEMTGDRETFLDFS
jgi:hypothetical protein